MPNNVTIEGTGSGTTLKLINHLDQDCAIFTNADYRQGNYGIVIRDMVLDGNKTNNTVTCDQRGVYFVRVPNPTGTWFGNYRLEGLIVQNFRNSGIHLVNCHNGVISNNNCRNNGRQGFQIYSGSSNNIAIGNVCTGNGMGFQCNKDAQYNVFANNIAASNHGHGIQIYEGCNRNTFVGNQSRDNDNNGFNVYQASNNLLEGNVISNNKQHGIYLNLSDSNSIENNTIDGSSQTYQGAFDNIRLSSSSYNTISSNMVRVGTGKAKYGANISDNISGYNCLLGNDLYNSGQTKDLNDMSATTIKRDNRGTSGWLPESL